LEIYNITHSSSTVHILWRYPACVAWTDNAVEILDYCFTCAAEHIFCFNFSSLCCLFIC